jgi:lauroyl/myristoyl acyltransferase
MQKYILNKKNVRRANNYFNSVKGSRNIPYGWGTKVISWFCKTEFAREKYFKGRKNLFSEFLSALPDEYDVEKLMPIVLYSNFLKGWRSSALSWMPKRKLKKYISFEGRHYLDDALKEGTGVIILNSHFGLAQAALTIFPMLGYDEFYTIVRAKGLESLKFEGVNEKYLPKLLAFKSDSQSELFKQMYLAREVLSNGGIVHLLGDGYHGMSSNTVNFLGKLRGFRPSYVDLSTSSGAIVLPTFIDCSLKGKVSIQICPALDKGEGSLSIEERRDHMTMQYARLLEEKWRTQPWNVNWRFIEKHLYQVDAE